MSRVVFTVPASFLLTGEYFVTEPGQPGLAIAADPCATVLIEPAQTLCFRSSWGSSAGSGADISWGSSAGNGPGSNSACNAPQQITADDSPLLAAVLDEWQQAVGSLADLHWPAAAGRTAPLQGARITVDTGRFFHADGSKRGFGSSAAACVGFCTALAWLHPNSRSFDRRRITGIAVQAHRRFQGGRGSGYDVTAAVYGGAGLFTGGDCPDWEPLPQLLPLLSPLWLLNTEPVSTPQSILGYSGFRHRHPARCEQLRQRNVLLHRQLAELCDTPRPSAADLLQLLSRARDIGIELGREIGVPAEPSGTLIQQLHEVPLVKAVGAGSETLMVFGHPRRPAPAAEPLLPLPAGTPLPSSLHPEEP
ncbi:phosphomevalonate kinase [Spirochaeta africana]|uniref:phosphomevalonate kinase n=1 Tax=Spirochaeta africana (strain ATCC 700263 / DSM 8902 / Z-7692) TaxID=889378 RepID=H9UG35_SPIAZ|nr:phosphomevalonate kinase [Spirochaeta africana]AFG36478.1 phosphomevalonate kinase [Spirochaeta africana DSM 8902]